MKEIVKNKNIVNFPCSRYQVLVGCNVFTIQKAYNKIFLEINTNAGCKGCELIFSEQEYKRYVKEIAN